VIELEIQCPKIEINLAVNQPVAFGPTGDCGAGEKQEWHLANLKDLRVWSEHRSSKGVFII
jgi:hypothetical protein